MLADEAFTPDSSRFWPADEYAPGGPQPSFDKQFVRDYCEALGWDKTAPGPGAARRGRRRDARPLRRGVRAPDRDRVRRLPRRPGGGAAMRATVLVRPKAGILDPQGEAVESSLRHLGFAVGEARVGRVVDLEVEAADRGAGPRRGRAHVRAAAREPADRELRDRADRAVTERSPPDRRRRRLPRVERRPGRGLGASRSRRRRRARLARRRGAPRGNRRRRPTGRVLVRRLPPLRRDRPLLACHARRGGIRGRRAVRCWASATGSRSSARPASFPACCVPNASLSFVCRDVAVRVEHVDTALHQPVRAGAAARHPREARRRVLVRAAGAPRRARGRRADRAPLRAGENPNGAAADVAGVATSRATSWA